MSHAILGPSSADRWLNCPGSVALTRDLPDEDSPYAKEGSAAHEVLEAARRGTRSLLAMLGTKTSNGVTVTQDMLDAAQYFMDHLAELPGVEFNEQKVEFTDWVAEGFGTLDAAKGNDGVVYIRDFKYGRGILVEAADNAQLKLYALGFLQTYGYLYEVETFNLGIVQPRLDHVDETEISTVDLLKWAAAVLVPGSNLALSADAPLKAGSWCGFCKIKATCETRARTAVSEALSEFDDLTQPPIPPATIRYSGSMTNAQIAKALESIPLLRSWIADIEGYTVRQLMQGQAVGEYKLVEGRTSRRWGVQGEQLDRAVVDAGVPIEDLYVTELRSPAQVEKALGKRRFKLIEDYVERVPGRATLAPGSDKRPALAVSAAAEFDVIEEEAE